jgi:hypothetical protein
MSDKPTPELNPDTFMTAQASETPETGALTDEQVFSNALMAIYGEGVPVESAIAYVRGMHAQDFDSFLWVMTFLSSEIRPNSPNVHIVEYIEVLYVTVKHAFFTEGTRTGIYHLTRPLPPGRPN